MSRPVPRPQHRTASVSERPRVRLLPFVSIRVHSWPELFRLACPSRPRERQRAAPCPSSPIRVHSCSFVAKAFPSCLSIPAPRASARGPVSVFSHSCPFVFFRGQSFSVLPAHPGPARVSGRPRVRLLPFVSIRVHSWPKLFRLACPSRPASVSERPRVRLLPFVSIRVHSWPKLFRLACPSRPRERQRADRCPSCSIRVHSCSFVAKVFSVPCLSTKNKTPAPGTIPGTGAQCATGKTNLVADRLEVPLRQFRLRFERLAPASLRVFFLTQRLHDMSQVQQRFREIRVFRERLAIQPRRFVGLPRFLQQQPGVVKQFRRPLAQIDEPAVEFERLVQVAALQSQRRQPAQRVQRLRIRVQRLLVNQLSQVAVAHLPVRQRQVHLRFDPVFALLQAGLEGLRAAPVIAPLQPHVAQPEPRLVVLRVFVEHLHVGLLGLVLLARLLEDERQVPQRRHRVRIQPHRLAIRVLRFLQRAQFLAHDAQVGVRLRRLRPHLDGLLIRIRGLLQPLRLLVRQAQVEPAFEVVRDGVHQQRAELRRHLEIAARRSPRRQSFQSRRRLRAQFQQGRGTFPHQFVILLRHPDRDQVRQRLFRIRIALQHLPIQIGRLVELRTELQRHGLAEHRPLVLRLALDHALEGRQRRLRLVQVQQADAQSQLRFRAGRIHLESFLELLRRFLPAPRALQAHGQVEPAHLMAWLDLQQLAVAVGRAFKLAQLELDLTHGRVDLRRFLALGHGALQFPQRLLGLPVQMQGDSAGDVARCLGSLRARTELNGPRLRPTTDWFTRTHDSPSLLLLSVPPYSSPLRLKPGACPRLSCSGPAFHIPCPKNRHYYSPLSNKGSACPLDCQKIQSRRPAAGRPSRNALPPLPPMS